ncbi:cysteine desulfurase NifS [Rhodoblastus acidophilus]|uniref:Cysteine desulfurase n=1 Tax=Candidatus Rhodoblastus alkanivorans TaxID=2954117 RepID=A0ABS9Z484_9HYPH|nr:cysteine desulfurase NifS [Candidatus Rhodoblastus alkanivorans]MCI4679232.1 cysteine desulfurase NifS [Candidatus Rhodoblastus alkanivorans]MCI4682444.1 cysteine desulfurase NifS [Candidatus Rhodoblastus alkanivorans]MDI4639750.1 cysteine desulfurase NifS [Rhodoblastus acidophilus]
MAVVYLDNNATTRVDRQVVEAMLPFFTESFGNASSTHDYGAAVAPALKEARKQVQALLGAEFDHEVVFTSGGTESDTTAIFSAIETSSQRNEIVTSAVEHPAVLNVCQNLERAGRAKVHYIGVSPDGDLDLDAFGAALSDKTALVSIMWANNETGKIFPIVELAKLAKSAGALFHTDAVQAFGKVDMALKDMEVDLLSLSAHKIHGPKGVGALYARKGVKLSPLFRGGKQERGRRAGTENVPGIVGLGAAAERARQTLAEDQARVKSLRDKLESGLLAAVPLTRVNGGGANRLPNTCNIAFDYADGEAVLHKLDRAGVAASSGSACASGSMEPSHVLRALDIPPYALQGAIRFSLSRETTGEDIAKVLATLPEIVANVREKSPLWAEVRPPQVA